MSDNYQSMGSSYERKATKYSVIAAFVLGTACVMYGGSSQEKNLTSLTSIPADIQLSMVEYPDLALEDFEGLNLKKVNKEKVMNAIDRVWKKLDKKGNSKLSKAKAKKATKKTLAILRKSDAYNEQAFNAFFAIADKSKDQNLDKDELKDLVGKLLDRYNAT